MQAGVGSLWRISIWERVDPPPWKTETGTQMLCEKDGLFPAGLAGNTCAGADATARGQTARGERARNREQECGGARGMACAGTGVPGRAAVLAGVADALGDGAISAGL